jgi:hypothetical protein
MIHRRQSGLRALSFFPRLLISADDIKRPPGQHAGDGIQVARIHIAAEPSNFWPMAESKDAKLLNNLWNALGRRAEVEIDVAEAVKDFETPAGIVY